MNIPQYVTVTIEMEHGAVLGDFRIPTGMSIGRLTELLQQECDVDLREPALCDDHERRERMLCPYCSNEMQHGEIFGDARGGMRFREDGKKLGFFEMLAGAGRITAVKGWPGFDS